MNYMTLLKWREIERH